MVVPLQWAIHTDPSYWHEPLRFKPERFIAQDGSLARPEAFLPFQAGEFACAEKQGKISSAVVARCVVTVVFCYIDIHTRR